MSESLLDRAGQRRSPATTPTGTPDVRRNKGQRYPAGRARSSLLERRARIAVGGLDRDSRATRGRDRVGDPAVSARLVSGTERSMTGLREYLTSLEEHPWQRGVWQGVAIGIGIAIAEAIAGRSWAVVVASAAGIGLLTAVAFGV